MTKLTFEEAAEITTPFGLTNDFAEWPGSEVPRKRKKLIDPSMYGPQEDFYTEDYLAGYVLHPVSKAAITWCENELPEGLPRYGIRGYVLNAVETDRITKAMQRDRLMSREEFDRAEEAENIARQGYE